MPPSLHPCPPGAWAAVTKLSGSPVRLRSRENSNKEQAPRCPPSPTTPKNISGERVLSPPATPELRGGGDPSCLSPLFTHLFAPPPTPLSFRVPQHLGSGLFFYPWALNFLPHLLPFHGSLSNLRSRFGLGFPWQNVAERESPREKGAEGQGETAFTFQDTRRSRDSAWLSTWRCQARKEPRRWAGEEGQARSIVRQLFLQGNLTVCTYIVFCKSIKRANFSRNVLFTFHRREGKAYIVRIQSIIIIFF